MRCIQTFACRALIAAMEGGLGRIVSGVDQHQPKPARNNGTGDIFGECRVASGWLLYSSASSVLY